MILALISLVFSAPGLTSEIIGTSYAEEETAKPLYTCPMHPQVKSHEPGKCPICHMKLVKVIAPPGKDSVALSAAVQPDAKSGEDHGHFSTSGRGAVHLAPGQFSLSGAALAHVERRDLILEHPVAGRALSSGRVALQVRERDIGMMKSGLEVSLTTPVLRGEIVMGKITSLDSALDPMTRTLRVDVALDRPHPQLRPESTVQAIVRRKLDGVIAIPREAVMPGAGGAQYAFVADEKNGKLIPKKIVLGAAGRDWVEVKEGLAEGEKISSGPNFLFDSESRIQAVQSE